MTQPQAASPPTTCGKTSGVAIASLVCGIVGPCTLGLASIAGIVLGIVGLKKIGASGGAVGGRGLAIAGLIISLVTLIIGLVLAVGAAFLWYRASVALETHSNQARGSATRIDIANIEFALAAFELDFGRYPTTEECLKALLEPPADPTRWRGPYLKRMPQDPWGNPYVYRYPGQHNADGFDLYSLGPDKREGGGDDIDNWSQR